MSVLFLKLVRVPRKIIYLITIAFLIVYCLLTGSRTPVVRATIMAVVLLFGYCLKREADIYNSLFFSALLILLFNPWQLFEVSFQLSFMSIASIVWLSPKIQHLFSHKLFKKKYLKILIGGFSVSFAAWLGLAPLIAYYFKIVSPVTILANMVVVPFMALVIASGVTFILGALISPMLGTIFSVGAELSLLSLFKGVSLFARIPGAYFYLLSVPVYPVISCYLLLFMSFNYVRRFHRS